MELNYRESISGSKPPEMETTETTVYLRKDYTSKDVLSEEGEVIQTLWIYKEAALTLKEFNEYSNLLMAKNAINGVNDSTNIVQIMDGQTNGDNNQLSIMEAIADLYEMVALMTPSE